MSGPAHHGHLHGERVHGLDTLRALAVMLTVLFHYQVFVTGASTFGVVGDIGWVGVDLFFALSGYLIGDQIMAPLARGERLALGRFYLRRFLRTLPNYWVVLALYFAVPGFAAGKALPPLHDFLLFTQNIGLQPGTAFSHAWSLCVEEQFYVALPLLAIAIASRRLPLPWTLAAASLLLGGGMAVRWWLWLRYGADGEGSLDYYRWIYYGTPTRLDELLAGVMIAAWKNFRPASFARATRHGRAWLAAGLGVSVATCGWLLDARYGLAGTVFGFPLLALGFGCLLMAAVSDGWLQRTRLPGAQPLALGSYALYLVHKQVGILLKQPLSDAGIAPDSAAGIACYLALSLLAAWLLYRLVETPFMRLRRRIAASPRGPAPAAAC